MHPYLAGASLFYGDSMRSKPETASHVYIEQGKKIVEKTEALGLLSFLYTSLPGNFFRFFLRRPFVSRLYGWYQSSRWSRPQIKKFIEKHNINMKDFVVPAGGYTSFNDFFCRSLAEGTRPIDSQLNALVSPADAKCWAVPEVREETTFFVKQNRFSLSLLLRDAALARYFEGGSLLLLRLAPYDYHRFHAPFAGFYSKPRHLGGHLESVNPLAFKNGCMPLIENERHLILVDSPVFNSKVAMLPVGAMCVGKIGYSVSLPAPLNKGEELGYFAFGGSTIVLLLPYGVFQVRADLAAYAARGFEVAVKMGESLGSFAQ